jgi:NAD(P)-dependent dehydrogenase (short-subunit alcohol dehydrogenase family)
MGAYAASKAALSSLTSTLRMEVGGKGVAVFGFDPGWVATDLRRRAGAARTRRGAARGPHRGGQGRARAAA